MSRSIPVQLAGFLAAGGLATGTHWTVMALLVAFGLEPALATLSGSVTGAAANYGLQRQLAFRSSSPHWPTLKRYVLACALAALANTVIFILVHHALTIPAMPAQAVTTAVVAMLNFIVYQRFVFHEHTSQ